MWRYFKQLPKISLVVSILVLSSGMFIGWWYWHSPARKEVSHAREEQKAEKVRKSAAEVEARMGKLLLVDNDLYDVEANELLIENWLSDGPPNRLFYDSASKKIIGSYELGYVRYALDGKRETAIVGKYPMLFSNDRKVVVFARDSNIWRADVDWKNWKVINEKQVTFIGQFTDAYFATNVLFATSKTIVARGLKAMLRVNLENGEVHPTEPPPIRNQKQRSPDGKSVIGLERDHVYCYDIDSDTTKAIPVPHNSAFLDYEWLDDDRCLCLTAGNNLMVYDRAKHALEKVMGLPAPCRQLTQPSPDKHYIFCVSQNTQLLIDLQKKTAVPVSAGQGHTWIDSGTFTFSRELPNSTLRGTWMQSAGSVEKRVSPQPYIPSRSGQSVLLVKSAGVVIFITTEGVTDMKPDGRGVVPLFKIATAPSRADKLPSRLIQILDWEKDNQ